MVVSLLLSIVVIPLGYGVAIFMYLVSPGPPIVVPALLLIPTVIVLTLWFTKGTLPGVLGAIAFYPIGALVIYGLYVANEYQYARRTIAHPLGPIAVLGLPLAEGECQEDCAHILLEGIAREVVAVSYAVPVDLQRWHDTGIYGYPWIFRHYRLGRGSECAPAAAFDTTSDAAQWRPSPSPWLERQNFGDVCIVVAVGDNKLGDLILIEVGPWARRPNGPSGAAGDLVDGAAVAWRMDFGFRKDMIARWEYGSYSNGGAPGAPFTLFDFAKALAGKINAKQVSERPQR
jgi:hypothetical protein